MKKILFIISILASTLSNAETATIVSVMKEVDSLKVKVAELETNQKKILEAYTIINDETIEYTLRKKADSDKNHEIFLKYATGIKDVKGFLKVHGRV